MLRETAGAALEKALDGAALRMEALADNIANAETPGYSQRRVSFEDSLQAAINAENQARPQGAQGAVERATPAVWREPVADAGRVTVNLETEMTELARTSAHYDALARTVAKRFRMLRTAIAGSG
jgi:flagellar basal-body rod protein FlgB